MERDRMSRREFLTLSSGLVGVGAIALYLGPKLYPFAGLLKRPEEGSIKPADFEKVIVTKEQDLSFGEGHKSVRLNTPAFAQAMFDVSNLMIPEGGAEALYAVLVRKPLIVEISPFDLDPDIVNGQRVETAGRYVRYLMEGGPKIIFTPIFLKEYYEAQSTFYEDLQKDLDAAVWHEIAHFIQDLKSPLANPIPLLSFNIQEAVYILGMGKEPDMQDLPREVEARRIGDEIAQAKLEEYSKYLNPQQSWPFGRFFTFL